MKKLLFVTLYFLLAYCIAGFFAPPAHAFLQFKGPQATIVTGEPGLKMLVLFGDRSVAKFFNRKDVVVVRVDAFAAANGHVKDVIVFYRMKK